MRKLAAIVIALCTACSAPTPPSVPIASQRFPINAAESAKPVSQGAAAVALSGTELPVFRGLDPKTFKGR